MGVYLKVRVDPWPDPTAGARETINLKGAVYMNIEQKKDGKALVLAPEGRLDTMTAPQLEAALQEALPGVEELTFDFEKLEYISSAGLRVLLSAQKTMNKQGTMKVIHANEMLMEIFEVTGFADILNIV